MKENVYEVGLFSFSIAWENATSNSCEPPCLLPFRRKEKRNADLLFALRVATLTDAEDISFPDALKVADFNMEGMMVIVFGNAACGYTFTIEGNDIKAMLSISPDYKTGRALICANEATQQRMVSNFAMIMYAFSAIWTDTLVIHASVILNNSKGYAFLGKSGTGKSTHSRLWIDHVDGSQLLNDDNPVVRLIDGKAYIFGSPWSGKTFCYKDVSANLAAVVRLSQAPENSIKQLNGIYAYAALFPSPTYMRWDDEMSAQASRVVESFISAEGLRFFALACRPDAEAATLCSKTVRS